MTSLPRGRSRWLLSHRWAELGPRGGEGLAHVTGVTATLSPVLFPCSCSHALKEVSG